MTFAFPVPNCPSLPILNMDQRFPVHRIYCVARNYADHAAEMGADTKEPPFFFMKPADAVVEPGKRVLYPSATKTLHHEVELVVALGKGGVNLQEDEALSHIYGYGVGIDLTRRDLQAQAKAKGRPWDVAKGFDQSAPMSAITPVKDAGHPDHGRIWLTVNQDVRQDGDLRDMIWPVPFVIAHLSKLFTLMPGDLIFTGTPSGVGPVQVGDVIDCGIDDVAGLSVSITD